MKVLICCIAKNEQFYLWEWVSHYLECGVDKVVIYDNNDVNTDLLRLPNTEVVDFRGRQCCQQQAYNDCYARYKNDYDWFGFLDVDEFLECARPLKEWLNDPLYANYDAIKVNWMNMTDSGLVCVENGNYSRTRFIEPTDKENIRNRQCKTLVRGGLNIHYGKTVHHPEGDIRFCDVLGQPRGRGNRTPRAIWEVAHIKHYRCRTIEEFINGKMQRLYPDQPAERARQKITMDLFWEYNRHTKEKEDYARRSLHCR